MIVPYMSLPGFSLTADLREVAAYYGVDWRALKKGDGRSSETMAFARHALFWKLTTERGMSPTQVARLLGASRGKVLEGAKLHAKRQDEFRITSGITPQRRKAND